MKAPVQIEQDSLDVYRMHPFNDESGMAPSRPDHVDLGVRRGLSVTWRRIETLDDNDAIL